MNWDEALGWALVGELIAAAPAPLPDPVRLEAALVADGWTRERISAHARERIAAETRWPHQIPAELRAGLGPAQLAAALLAVRERMGLAELEVRPPAPKRALDADERRLLGEVPPHHVG